MAIYASWIPLFLTVLLAEIGKAKPKKGPFFFAGAGFLVFASLFTLSPQATVQWWGQILILILFVRALVQLRVPVRVFVAWMVFSLLPHALLGLEQYAAQMVQGSKWLGIAAQDPMTPGVSVIETGGVRLLRAYGGFPHPNIFGGWLAVMLPFTIWLAQEDRKKALLWTGIGAFFSATLVLTYSRSAWLAALIGVTMAMFFLPRPSKENLKKNFGWLAAVAILFSSFFVGFHEFGSIASRFQTASRLEAKSMEERSGSFSAGWNIFLHHPFLGAGPNASLFAPESGPVPTHMVPLLALSEVGLVGSAGLILLFWHFRKRFHPHRVLFATAAVLIALMFFDHYLWSLWSGQTLAACVIAAVLLDKTEEPATVAKGALGGQP